MRMVLYFILSITIAALTLLSRNKRMVALMGVLFFLVQAALLGHICKGGYGQESGHFFLFDAAGTLFFVLQQVVGAFVFLHSAYYLKEDTFKEYRLYFTLLLLLMTAITGVYFSDNIAVTWILLEATTLCAAGIIYYRREAKTLEATWKYVFVCSTGIAMAYLGILLLCSVAEGGSIDYHSLGERLQEGNPLFLKIAFLLVLSGYSCKMEIFPLYTIGIDANYAAPSPASALISTALVNAGFLAIFRIYRMMAHTEIFDWMRAVMIIVGLLSLAIGALFLRRTNHYKRFLSYSTVENMGIVAIGLGIGGVGVWAALLHVVCHTLIKSSLFLQMAVVRQIYDSYRINRLGDYLSINKVGAIGLLVGTVVLLAFPPSPLFVSEVMIFKAIFTSGKWWLAAAMLVLMCIVLYSVSARIIKLCYQPNQEHLHPTTTDRMLSWSALILLFAAMVVGLWQPTLLCSMINQIATF